MFGNHLVQRLAEPERSRQGHQQVGSRYKKDRCRTPLNRLGPGRNVKREVLSRRTSRTRIYLGTLHSVTSMESTCHCSQVAENFSG